jgi:hypothetical protein
MILLSRPLFEACSSNQAVNHDCKKQLRPLLIVIDGKLQPVEIKLTATPSAGHVDPINQARVPESGQRNPPQSA